MSVARRVRPDMVQNLFFLGVLFVSATCEVEIVVDKTGMSQRVRMTRRRSLREETGMPFDG